MTLTCKTLVNFNTDNIGKYIDLSPNDIVCVKYGKTNHGRTILLNPPKHRKRVKKAKKNFLNQVTVLVRIREDKIVNTKLFSNGSIQMTGCQDLDDAFCAIAILIEKLRTVKVVMNLETRAISEKPFMIGTLEMKDILDLRVHMINSNFNINFKVDRFKLYNLITELKGECRFDPIKHAGVIIKYKYDDTHTISIIVFESGYVIITGAKLYCHIMASYQYISLLLLSNYHKVIKMVLKQKPIKKSEKGT